MFNMKVIFFVSCLIVAAIADEAPVEVTGALKLVDVDVLRAELLKVAPAVIFTVVNIDKVFELTLTDGIVYTYEGRLKNKAGIEKQCKVVLTHRPPVDSHDHLKIECDGESANT